MSFPLNTRRPSLDWTGSPFPRYTAIPKPETLVHDLTSWEHQVLLSDGDPPPLESSPSTHFQRTRALLLTSQGLSSAQIATRLGLTPAQVRAIRRRALSRGSLDV